MDRLKEHLKSKRGDVYIAPEGFISFVQPKKDSIKIIDIYISRDTFDRSKVAEHFIYQVCATARERGCKYVDFITDNEFAQDCGYMSDMFMFIRTYEDQTYYRREL